MRNKKAMFTSEYQNWKTPKAFFQALDAEFSFDFDPCPPNPDFDGLNVSWGKSNFVNPPYNELSKWLSRGYKEHQMGNKVVFLIPSRTDTKWWHEIVMKADEIRFIKGRLTFEGAKSNAPFPSCVVVFLGEEAA